MNANQPSFEAALTQLEDRVNELEQGGLTLEEALARFEEGMRLVAHCDGLLDAAELRVTRLLTEDESAEPSDDEEPALPGDDEEPAF
jgi:exodeoxyribonuclease VII small subunit